MKKETKIITILGSCSAFVVASLATLNLLDTFIIPKEDTTAVVNNNNTSTTSTTTIDVASSDNSSSSSSSTSSSDIYGSHQAKAINSSLSASSVALSSGSINNSSGVATKYYFVDIILKTIDDLRSHVETNSSGYPGSGIAATPLAQVSEVESSGCDVLAAINGDYAYWTNKTGYVIRNGSALRSSYRSGSDATNEDLVLFNDGSMYTYDENEISTSDLISNGAYQSWAFGPTLLENGTIEVTTNQVVTGQSMSYNEMTSIGYISPLHYVFFMSEGRTKTSSGTNGITLYQMATLMKNYGCLSAYNLDGGNSSCLIYNDVSQYSVSHSSREVSDIIYVVNK